MPQFTGQNLIYLDEVDSTNRYAATLLSAQPPEGTVVQAGFQAAGRGQMGNEWWAAPGLNLTFSLIWYPRFLAAVQVHALSKLTALAVRDTVAHWCPGHRVEIKWPNDILLDRRKVAGILIENTLGGGQVRATVIGIGLNVNQVAFPDALAARATSLAAVQGALPLEAVFTHLLDQLESRYLALRSGGQATLDRAYLDHLYGYHELVHVRCDGQRYQWRLIGVDVHGRLALDTGSGLRYFDVKEVQLEVEG